MDKNNSGAANSGTLTRYISPAAAWALSFGCIVGWGAFMMPGTTFLPMAGPAGTVAGMVIGGLIMLVIAVNYRYMMRFCPDAGGTFAFAKKTFGGDHGFLSAWFMVLAYMSILWANVTALALVARSMLGGVLQFGYMYTIAGYDVYLGEVLAELAVMLVFGAVCMISSKAAVRLQIIFAGALFLGVILCFVLAVINGSNNAGIFSPAFADDGSAVSQILGITALAPWAFVGFESVSNSTEEYRFPIKRILVIMVTAIIAGAVTYILLVLIAATSQPEGYADWSQYIADLGSCSGIESMPVFYAMKTACGDTGLIVLAAALLGAVCTGIIGSIVASARLLYAMSKDGLFPALLSRLTPKGIPRTAIAAILAFSAVIPFLGRTAIGWVVDVITVGTTIAYAYTSAAAFKCAKVSGNRRIRIFGIAGVVISAFICLLLLIPDLVAGNALSAESYLLLAFWGIIGIVYFRSIFGRDKNRRFGTSTVVWLALLFLIFFTSLMWVRQVSISETQAVVDSVSSYYTDEMAEHGVVMSESDAAEETAHLSKQLERIDDTLTRSSLIQMLLIMFTLIVIFNIYRILNERERDMEAQKIKAEESSKAKSAFLSNMSHDIRTPLNAIVGYIGIAKDEKLTHEETREYLAKIENSSKHLVTIINDILEMSRIESGKLEPTLAPTDLRSVMNDIRDLFSTQMSEKDITYTVSCGEADNYGVMCDRSHFSRVLINLVGNAYKFTPPGGSVTVTLRQTGEHSGDVCHYELRVRDNGIGMSEEFAEKVFEAFERERTSTVSGIQGTGLGMAITKSIIDIMGGTITVHTAPGKGTEFVITLAFRKCACPESSGGDAADSAKNSADRKPDFSEMRLLLADDVMINREIAAKILRRLGFTVDTVANGQEALDMVSGSEPGYYNGVIMDIQMPVMDGFEATQRIRRLPDPVLASIPVIAMTANAFTEDVLKCTEAGMNAHIAKPIDIEELIKTLNENLGL